MAPAAGPTTSMEMFVPEYHCWQENVIVLKSGLEFSDVLFIDAARIAAVRDGDSGGGSRRLPEEGAGRHDADGAEADVRAGDVAAREHEIREVARVEASVRYCAVDFADRVKYNKINTRTAI